LGGEPLIGLAAVEVAPVVVSAGRAVTTTVLANPATVATVQKVVSNFTLGATPGSPPPTNWTGFAGTLTNWLYGQQDKISMYFNPNPKP